MTYKFVKFTPEEMKQRMKDAIHKILRKPQTDSSQDSSKDKQN